MARIAPRVPEMADLLCEGCGYVLNGLPHDGRCPECGKAIAESLGRQRVGPAWDAAAAPASLVAVPLPAAASAIALPAVKSVGFTGGFLRTTAMVLFHPTRFYRTLNVRGSVESARQFARLHWWLASLLLGITVVTHASWFFWQFMVNPPSLSRSANDLIFAAAVAVASMLIYFGLNYTTRLAARLTTWEATYRGLRLPREVVLRGLYFHAAHYLPVAAAAATIVVGYQALLAGRMVAFNSWNGYLYTLCGLVIVAAGYLFNTYWIGMRNMMYANR
jgi:hypothetical protein